jgi:uncharacterized protein YhfF
MKTIKFRPALAQLILEGKKTTTWRLFDDKDLKVGDDVELMNWETKEVFGHAVITEVSEKAIKDLDNHDWEGHERFPNDEAMYADYRTYYPGREIGPDTLVKIFHFKLAPDYSVLVTHEWSFGDDQTLSDKLKQLVLSGTKTATTGLWREDKKLPVVGDYEAILDSDGRRFCIIQITDVKVKSFLEVDYDFVKKEGEGYSNLEAWRQDHRRVFHQWSEIFTDQSLVICEEFKLIQTSSANKR